jgi:(R,R)-butanediol dehydrogenase/meso-butanediol dehydrogenase/diacetyl reductase
MFAGLITGKGQLEMIEFPDPTPQPSTAVVDIIYCGICGTDIHAYQSGDPYNPAICGHEWTGHVSAVGAEVSAVNEGDRVVVAVPPACGRCRACHAGQTDRCIDSFSVAVGMDALAPPHGGFASQIAVDARRLVRADSALSDEQAAQVEPATVAFHAVRASNIMLGDTAVVQGAGPIGLITLQWVKAAGAGKLIVIEPNSERQSAAVALGATSVTTPDQARRHILDETKGLGADIVYECVGRPETVQTAVDHTRRGGKMCLIGLATAEVTINPMTWLMKEVAVTSAMAYFHEDFETAMGMIADGRIELDSLHTSTIGLDQLGTTLETLASGSTDQTKVLVRPQ